MTTSTTALAAIYDGPGRPMRLDSYPVPEVSGGEVLVRVICCTICGSDLRTISGARPAAEPTVLGHEILGEVMTAGGEVCFFGTDRPVSVGDRVTWAVAASCGHCRCCQRGIPQKCDSLFKYGHESVSSAGPFSGGLAEVCILRRGTAILPVPEGMEDVVAAPANCATATAVATLRVADLPPDGTLLVQGGGLLGLSVCGIAASRGARVLVVDPDENRRGWAKRFGAEAARAPDDAELDAVVAQLTDGVGFEAAVEASGSLAALDDGLGRLALRGTYVLAGTVSPTPGWSVDPERVVRRLLRIEGIHNYTPDDLVAALEYLATQGAGLPFRDVVVASYRLQDLEAAVARATQPDALRVAITPDP
ncbi:MAG: alcohol dehydrogenase [Planctomycetes bacterium]|nr:alcohol dehydrogenase [Planctomycetota bacterium]